MSAPTEHAAVSAVMLSPGVARSRLIKLDEPLSFWGGVDIDSGKIVDRRHPQLGVCLTGQVLAMTQGRGSSSGSSVLAEAIRAGTAPCAILLAERDEIVALGSIVADEIYGIQVPVVVLGSEDYEALRSGATLEVDAAADGRATVRDLGLGEG